MNSKNVMDIITKYFDEQQDISTAYLFGSAAKGMQRTQSDIDIAILFVDSMHALERFERKLEIANKIEKMIGIKVDVVDLESSDVYFIHQMMLKKLIVADKNIHRRVEFEVKMRRTYFDMQPFYEFYYKQALNRLERMYLNGRT